MIYASVKLAKSGQGSRSHPHDQVLVFVAIVALVAAQIVDRSVPVLGLNGVGPRARVSELYVFVRSPRDSGRQQVDANRIRLTVKLQCKRVIEQ